MPCCPRGMAGSLEPATVMGTTRCKRLPHTQRLQRLCARPADISGRVLGPQCYFLPDGMAGALEPTTAMGTTRCKRLPHAQRLQLLCARAHGRDKSFYQCQAHRPSSRSSLSVRSMIVHCAGIRARTHTRDGVRPMHSLSCPWPWPKFLFSTTSQLPPIRARAAVA